MSPSHTNEGDRGYVALPLANETPAFRGVSVKGEIYNYVHMIWTVISSFDLPKKYQVYS